MPAVTATTSVIHSRGCGGRGGGGSGRTSLSTLSTHATVFTIVMASGFLITSLRDVHDATERSRQLLAAPLIAVTQQPTRAGASTAAASAAAAAAAAAPAAVSTPLSTVGGSILSTRPASMTAPLADVVAAPLPPAPPETEWLLKNNFAPTACAKHGELNQSSTTAIVQSVGMFGVDPPPPPPNHLISPTPLGSPFSFA